MEVAMAQSIWSNRKTAQQSLRAAAEDLAGEIATLNTLEPAALLQKWKALFGTDPSPLSLSSSRPVPAPSPEPNMSSTAALCRLFEITCREYRHQAHAILKQQLIEEAERVSVEEVCMISFVPPEGNAALYQTHR
jgi:hypothetical protein